MKTKLLLTALTTLSIIFTLNSCCRAPEAPKKATPDELSQMNRDFAKALVAKDAAAAANLYAEDASILPPNEAIVKGRVEIKKYWQGVIDAGLIDGSVSTIATGSEGDLGYEIGNFELKFKGPDGKITIDQGKYTEILKRDSTGKWISIYGTWNPNTPPAE